MSDVADITSNAVQTIRRAKNPKGLATAGAALVALPYAAQGISRLKGKAAEKAKDATDKAKDVAGDVAGEKLKPDDGGDGSAHGSGRRMPIQQSVDVAVPTKVAYDLWTRFEDWPTFMHRVESVDQVDDATLGISTKVWGVNRSFEAEIVEQRPDQRIEWNVKEGLSHTGVVTFHELAPRLTRIEVTLDVQPEGLLEKMGRGMRFAKRAVRGDLHRFKAYAEVAEEAEDGGWRGAIEDGKVKRRKQRKSSRSASRGRSRSGHKHSKNGSDPSSGSSRRAGSHG
jgi:uncharacterized membrane protein